MSKKDTQLFSATKEAVLDGVEKVLSDYKVAALTRRGEQSVYDYINTSREIEWEYSPTILSPKKFFFPHEEVILEYTSDGKVSAKIEAEPFVLFGIRPCDLNGIKILDEAFSESHGDPNYLSKREQAVIIGMDCKKVCSEEAFCYNVNAQYADPSSFDLMLYDVKNRIIVEVSTPKGEAFLNRYFSFEPSNATDKEACLKEKEVGFEGKIPFKNLDQFPEMFESNKEHPIWETEGNRCLSCGSCIMGCPTCYCFDVADELALNLKKGERIRRWDACMLSDFSVVAGGENFRHSAIKRLHHRIDRKFNYLIKKHGQSVCVGCGRCVKACLAEISPKTIAQALIEKE